MYEAIGYVSAPAPLMIGAWRKSAGKSATAASAAAVTPAVEPATNLPSAFFTLGRRQAGRGGVVELDVADRALGLLDAAGDAVVALAHRCQQAS